MTESPFFTWQVRNALKEAIRTFFTRKHFLEVDTPIAVPCPGSEVHLNYFKTQWQDYHHQDHTFWLRSSPELHMKQVLALGQQNIFQISTCFRNGGERSAWHHPEFLMLEWYQCGGDFMGFIDQTYELMQFTRSFLAKKLASGSIKLELPEATIPKLTIAEAFEKFANITLEDNDPNLAAKARAQGIHSVGPKDDFETAYFKILIERIEPQLALYPAIALYNYPPSQSALAKVESGWARRFEIYVQGIELCNGFHELTDAHENRARFAASNQARLELGKEVPAEDQGFWEALTVGLPECCGNALGFERWLALLLGETSLDRVVPFRNQQFILP